MTSYKRILSLFTHGSLLLCLTVLGSMAPVTAQGSEDPTASAAQFCDSLEGTEDRILTRIRTAQQDVQADWTAQAERFDLMSSQRHTDMQQLHTRIDEERQKNVTAMRALYAEQGQAISDYSQAITRSIAQYRDKLQEAQQTFETSAEDDLAKRQAARAGHVEAFRIAVTDALQATKVACAENAESPASRTTLIKQLQAARSVYSESLGSDTISTQLNGLVATRDAAWNKAEQTVASRMTSAGSDLRAALKQQ
jgi:hypothetical protein